MRNFISSVSCCCCLFSVKHVLVYLLTYNYTSIRDAAISLHPSRFAGPHPNSALRSPAEGWASLARGARARQEGASTVARSLKLFSHNRKARGGADGSPLAARRMACRSPIPLAAANWVVWQTRRIKPFTRRLEAPIALINNSPRDNFSCDTLRDNSWICVHHENETFAISFRSRSWRKNYIKLMIISNISN